MFGILTNCHTFIGQNVIIMKNPLYELIKKIVLEILTDLLDDGKFNGSNRVNKNLNAPE